MLSAIAEKFKEKGLVSDTWESETQTAGDLVALYREYYDGDHRLKLTSEMKKMMQIGDARLDRYNANYCEMVINAMADRLTVDRIAVNPDADDDPAQQWANAMLRHNRFDALQIDIREAALRDGETFVMMEYDENSKQIELYHNGAWDGDDGIIVVMDASYKTILAGVKAWWEGNQKRVNIYYPDTVEYYTSTDGALAAYEEPKPTIRYGEVPGVPIIRFSSKKMATSELKNVIPLQDSLNRTLVSMIMAAELTAFSVMFAKGWKPPQAITPGMIYHAELKDANGSPIVPQDEDQARTMAAIIGSYSLERIQGGSLTELINQADWIISQIEAVTSTPVDLSSSASGEHLKQLDVRLQGKIGRAQVSFGNSYEDLVRLAITQDSTFGGNNPKATETISTEWKSAEIRNDADVLALFKHLNDAGYERAALRALSKSSLADFTEAQIDQMLAEKAADTAQSFARSAGALPGFDQFNFNTN